MNKTGKNLNQALARAKYFHMLMDLEIDATTSNTDLNLMAERIRKECKDLGFEPEDVEEYLYGLRAEAIAQALGKGKEGDA